MSWAAAPLEWHVGVVLPRVEPVVLVAVAVGPADSTVEEAVLARPLAVVPLE